MNNLVGKIFGGALIAAATVAVWMWPEHKLQQPEDTSVRPIRSEIVTAGFDTPDLYFPARIKAGETRKMSFKRPGRVASLPVTAGNQMKKGEVLATLEKETFENAVKIAEADLIRDKSAYDRRLVAADKNAISKEELSMAEAQYKQSLSRLNDAKLALEETVLVAPFDGVVSGTCLDELANVNAGEPVLIYLDVSKVQVKVVVPETMVIKLNNLSVEEHPETFTVSFDSAPGLSFPVKYKEFEATANEGTQTFVACFELESPKELTLLPGMSGTLKLNGKFYSVGKNDVKAVTVPESAVGIKADGSAFVWVLSETGTKDVFVVNERTVVIGSRARGKVRIESGIVAGERVATAGVAVLTEGRKVRLLGE